ncbi:outer membrane lipoprotein SlyB [Azospirillum brasilense]|uniref:Outer membrane lipoprotein SlyB n=2 Tax=Azospirillum brasilense TaxID=192 RepID=A0A560CHX3_AZOBR|nr:outer membrane lipoprotein SlyB [Azospirillum brasilense]
MFGLPAAALVAGILAGCTPNYSPNTYAATATQQANKVERAVVIGFRQVKISTSGTVGAVTGGAAGGVLGSQSGTFGINSALGAVGGTAIGGLLGTSIEHVTGDTTGWEYIVRKPDGELLSVTQREEKPIEIGQKVLVIAGSQARIVADYSTDPTPAPEIKDAAKDAAKDTPKDTLKEAAKDEAKPAAAIEAEELPAPAPAETPAEAPASAASPPDSAPLRITPPAAPVVAPAPEPAPAAAMPADGTPTL